MLNSVNISLAIPDSCLSDEQTMRDKTLKVSQISRASSIFRVKRIYIYHDISSYADNKSDRKLIKLILQYLDTPQYLRRILFPHLNELKYAGILHPIKAPHHKEWRNIRSVKEGEIRVGVVVKVKNKLFVDVGLGPLVPFDDYAIPGRKLNVRLKSSFPNLRANEVSEKDLNFSYWGYKVQEEKLGLHSLLSQISDSEIVITSRKGYSLKKFEYELSEKLKLKPNILLVFGSPRMGIDEILSHEGYSVNKYPFIINMFPYQGTQTVRLEEAILGALAIMNYYLYG